MCCTALSSPSAQPLPLLPVFARYLQVIIAEVDAVQRAKVAEIQVLGSGIAPAGNFVSPPLDLGRPGERKNFTSVRWGGQVPDGTALGLQFRSSNDGSTWSDWSAPMHTSPALLQVPEPRTFLQYRVNLETQVEDAGPRLDSLIVDFTDQIPASLVRGWVEPNRAVLGRDTLFTYRLELDFSADDLGVERVHVALPSQIELEEIVPPSGMEIAATTASSTALDIVLAEPWRQAGTLEMRFRGRLLSNVFQFRAQVSGPDGGATLDAEENIEPDPDSGQPRSWEVSASGVEGSLLSHVRPVPQAFSPNGDGINDEDSDRIYPSSGKRAPSSRSGHIRCPGPTCARPICSLPERGRIRVRVALGAGPMGRQERCRRTRGTRTLPSARAATSRAQRRKPPARRSRGILREMGR